AKCWMALFFQMLPMAFGMGTSFPPAMGLPALMYATVMPAGRPLLAMASSSAWAWAMVVLSVMALMIAGQSWPLLPAPLKMASSASASPGIWLATVRMDWKSPFFPFLWVMWPARWVVWGGGGESLLSFPCHSLFTKF